MIAGACERDVHEPALLLGFFLVVQTPRRWKPAVDSPDHEDRVPFLAFGRVCSAENKRVVLFLRPTSEVLRRLRWLERERR